MRATRIICFFLGHRWRLIARSDRHDRMKHVHPLAGCIACCKTCKTFWDDFPGTLRKSTRNL